MRFLACFVFKPILSPMTTQFIVLFHSEVKQGLSSELFGLYRNKG